MNALHTFASLKNIVTLGMSTMVILSCGSFQGASYFESDGIYTSRNEIRQIPIATAQQDTSIQRPQL